jgi:hypothetical protein
MHGFGEDPISLCYLVARYLHVVCTTLLVGGTLFYEMVVPVAIGELRPETQMLVFGRARWVFRWIVWLCAVMLLISGVVVTYQYWTPYMYLATTDNPQNRPGWWWAGHFASGFFAITISLMLTIGARPPDRPLTWMRFNLIVLMTVMFLGSATRHVREAQLSPPIPFTPQYLPMAVPEEPANPAPAPNPPGPAVPGPSTSTPNHADAPSPPATPAPAKP